MVQSEAIPVLLASRGCRRLHPDREVETEDSGRRGGKPVSGLQQGTCLLGSRAGGHRPGT